MSDARKHQTQVPFRTDQIRSGDACELSQGHPIVCAPTGRDDTIPNGLGFAVLEYAGHGQDEDELKLKIRQLLEGGTRWV